MVTGDRMWLLKCFTENNCRFYDMKQASSHLFRKYYYKECSSFRYPPISKILTKVVSRMTACSVSCNGRITIRKREFTK